MCPLGLAAKLIDFDASKTICAPNSQSCIIFGENQGKQYVANSLISIVYQHHRLIRSAADMAQILHREIFIQLSYRQIRLLLKKQRYQEIICYPILPTHENCLLSNGLIHL